MMQKKILTVTVALAAAIGLAGCSSTTTSQSSHHEVASAKVAKTASHKTVKANRQAKQTTADQTPVSQETDNPNQTNAKATAVSPNSASTSSTDSRVVTAQPAGASTATEQSTGTTGTTQTTSTPVSQATAKETNGYSNVLKSFLTTQGAKANNHDQYLVTKQSNHQYQIEVRNSDGDPHIAHLSGLYQYDPTTNQVSSMNMMTGQFN